MNSINEVAEVLNLTGHVLLEIKESPGFEPEYYIVFEFMESGADVNKYYLKGKNITNLIKAGSINRHLNDNTIQLQAIINQIEKFSTVEIEYDINYRWRLFRGTNKD